MPTDDLIRVTVRGRALHYATDRPIQTPFIFTPAYSGALVDATADAGRGVFFDALPVTVYPDPTGYFEVDLPATNDPSGNPSAYNIRVQDPTRPGIPYFIDLDKDITPDVTTGKRYVNLSDVIPAGTPDGGTSVLVQGGISQAYADAHYLTTAAISSKADVTALTAEASARTSADSTLTTNKADLTFVNGSFAKWAPDATGTDDTSALNTLLTASAGQQVRFKPGQVYKVSNSLNVPTGTKVDLTGAEIQQISANKVTFNLTSVTDVVVRGGKLTGLGTDFSNSTPVSFGIALTGCTDVLIDGCRIVNHAGAGVYVNSTSSQVTISRCRIKGTGTPSITAGNGSQDCIRLDGGSSDVTIADNDLSDSCIGIIAGNTVSDLTIVGNRIHDMPGQHGMYIQNGSGLVVANNRVRTVNITGIKIQLDSGATGDWIGLAVTGNNISDTSNAGVGLLIWNTDTALAHVFRNVTVTGNTINDTSASGLYIDSCYAASVVGNVIGNATGNGMHLSNVVDATFAENIIHDCAVNGISLLLETNGTIARVVLRGNQVRNVASAGTASANYGIFVSDGTDVTLDSNNVTASHANMKYGIYFSAGDQTSATFRDNYVANANDYGMRFIAATNVREYNNNNVSGTTGSVLNLPPNAVLGTPAGTADVQTFATAGAFTWTKPSGAKLHRVEGVGGGAGGASGRRGAAGTVRNGGGGGGGAGRFDALLNPSDLGATVNVVVGAGGTGGAAVTADSTDGNAGSAGGDSRFGDTSGIQLYARTGNPGAGGTATTGTGGVVSVGMFPGAAGGTASTTGGVGVTGGGTGTAGGGGSGGGITSADSASAGGSGSVSNFSNSRTVTVAGTVGAGQNGAAGAAGPAAGMGGDGGGGGAASITGAAGTGGAGGAPGAGGGGGGASLNGNNSGAGGAGGAGFVRVTTYF